MRTIHFLLIALLFFLSTNSLTAQTDSLPIHTDYKNLLKINVLSTAFGIHALSYERALGEKISAQVTFTYAQNKRFLGDDVDVLGYAITPEFRVYPGKDNAVFSGFYLGSALHYYKILFDYNADAEDTEDRISVAIYGYGAGIRLGWNKGIGESKAFNLGLGLGLSAASTNFEERIGSKDRGSLNYIAWTPNLSFSLGYAF